MQPNGLGPYKRFWPLAFMKLPNIIIIQACMSQVLFLAIGFNKDVFESFSPWRSKTITGCL